MACVSLHVGEHVHQCAVKGKPAGALRPPRDLADGIQRKRVDRGVGVGPRAAQKSTTLCADLTGSHPHVAVRLAVLHPRQRLRKGAAEHGLRSSPFRRSLCAE